MSIKSFVKSFSIYGLIPIFGKFISILLLPLYTRLLSPSDYGAQDILVQLAIFLTFLINLEMYSGGIEIFTNIIYNDEDYIILIFLDHQNNIHFMNHKVEGFNDWKDLKVLISSDQIDSIKKTMEKLVKKVLPSDFWKVRSSLN